MKFLIGFPCHDATIIDYWGGLRVIKKLISVLTDLGHTVYILGDAFSNGKTITLTDTNHLNMDDIIVIYPELVIGNPYNAKNVVRWILYHAKPEVESTWLDTDFYFYFFDYYKSLRNEDKKFLTLYDFRLDEFKDLGLNREGYCHLIYKNNVDESFVEKYNSTPINKWNWEETKQIFNEKKYFLTYDDSTYFLNAAALCGCIPIVLYKEKKQNYRTKYPLAQYGVAYGFEEIGYAVNTIHLMKPYLQKLEEKSFNTVEEFIIFWENKLNI